MEFGFVSSDTEYSCHYLGEDWGVFRSLCCILSLWTVLHKSGFANDSISLAKPIKSRRFFSWFSMHSQYVSNSSPLPKPLLSCKVWHCWVGIGRHEGILFICDHPNIPIRISETWVLPSVWKMPNEVKGAWRIVAWLAEISDPDKKTTIWVWPVHIQMADFSQLLCSVFLFSWWTKLWLSTWASVLCQRCTQEVQGRGMNCYCNRANNFKLPESWDFNTFLPKVKIK